MVEDDVLHLLLLVELLVVPEDGLGALAVLEYLREVLLERLLVRVLADEQRVVHEVDRVVQVLRALVVLVVDLPLEDLPPVLRATDQLRRLVRVLDLVDQAVLQQLRY